MHKALEIVYEDEDFIAINKPAGYFVHNTSMAAKGETFLLQMLRDQLGTRIYTTHRLDKKTTGVLIFTYTKEAQSKINELFRNSEVSKSYLAIVRGWTEAHQIIDSDVKDAHGNYKSAFTKLECLDKVEKDIPSFRHSSSRFSLVKLTPETGRFHQLRQHMAKINHPIIADRPHGCNKTNRQFKELYSLDQMMLHAHSISFSLENKAYHITAPLPDEYIRIKKVLNIK